MFENIGLKSNNYIILDTETTGLASNDEVIELAIVDINGTVLYESIFLPTKVVSPFIRKLTGLHKADFIGKPTFANEWEKIKKIMTDKIVIGHNVMFDKRLMKQTLDIYGIDSSCIEKMFCGFVDTVALVKKYLKLGSYKQEDIANAFCVNNKNAHRAASDCITLLEILKILNDGDVEIFKKAETNMPEIIRMHNPEYRQKKRLEEFHKQRENNICSMIDKGMAVEEIAKTLGKAVSTIQKNILEYINNGIYDYSDFLTKEVEENILNVIKSIKDWDGRKKIVFEKLEGRGTYFDIDLVIKKYDLYKDFDWYNG